MTVKPLTPAGRTATFLAARLQGVRGFTGRGSVSYVDWPGAARRLVIKLRGIAGVSVDIFVDDARIGGLPVRKGAAAYRRLSLGDEAGPALAADDRIEIRQNGDLILEGALAAADPFSALHNARNMMLTLWKISLRAGLRFLRIFESRH